MSDSDRSSRFLDEMRCLPKPTRPPPKTPVPPKGTVADPPGFDPVLFEKLREWRLTKAKERNVPAYVVFTDRTLRAIAAQKPKNRRELDSVSGVGPTKMEFYGEEVLQIVREHLAGEG